MAQSGKDKSGNVFKFSLIPLLGGVLLIFGLYYGCNQGTVVHEAKPATVKTQKAE